MNTRHSFAFPEKSQRSRQALTILEMLVSVALLSFIVLGLTAMFVQTTKAFKTGVKQTDVTDAGRTIVDMIAADFSQLADPHFTNHYFYPPTNDYQTAPSLYWGLVTPLTFSQLTRTNETEDLFAIIQTNSSWLGIGYTVSNWFTNSAGGAIPGVGTLYRYVGYTNGPLGTNTTLYSDFSTRLGLFPSATFRRIADGVVHLKIYAYDADGNEMEWQYLHDSGAFPQYTAYQYPTLETNSSGVFVTNYLPHSIDIELGILEPEAFEHARAMYSAGATQAAGTYLTNAAAQVEIFRQHIVINAAP